MGGGGESGGGRGMQRAHVTYGCIITHSHASHLQSHEEEDTGAKGALVGEVHLCQAPPAAAACGAARNVRGGVVLDLERVLGFCLLGLECVHLARTAATPKALAGVEM